MVVRSTVSLLVLLMAGAWTAAQQPPRYRERVDVARILIDARALDEHGDPLPGLTAADFLVRIDGKKARVETAIWSGAEDAGALREPRPAPPPTATRAAEGLQRLIVFLFQKDLEPSRIGGLMQMLIRSRNFLDTLGPDDRIAILSFDSHLKIWTDFTNDRVRLDRVLSHGILFETPAAVQASPAPSLVERLSPDAGRHAYGIERALQLIAEALEPLPGSKSLIVIGYGFGRFSAEGVSMENAYAPAREALQASRTAVFSLDVTDADYHSLEAGLRIVARDTGGFYASTNVFPTIALRKLAGALSGYYALFVEKPAGRRGRHTVAVELAGRRGVVLATDGYVDAAP